VLCFPVLHLVHIVDTISRRLQDIHKRERHLGGVAQHRDTGSTSGGICGTPVAAGVSGLSVITRVIRSTKEV
jgi:hypothetical protein